MSTLGPAHPLDVDLADLADGVLDDERTDLLEAHVSDCLLCRIKAERLRRAPPAPASAAVSAAPAPSFRVPASDTQGEPAPGELWLAGGGDEFVIALVLRNHAGRALVAPVTLDTDAADDEAVILDDASSPLGTGLALHPGLATDLPRAALTSRLATLATDEAALDRLLAGDGPGLTRGAPIDGATDPRLELRQLLADRLGAMEHAPPDPTTRADAPPPPLEDLTSSLIGDLRALRGRACTVRPLDGWAGLVLAHRNGWSPLFTIDELGVVLVAFDTPHGLVDDTDFDAARSVLTRFTATALVVLTRTLGDSADVFDSSSLNYGIDMPSGAHTPPRPLITGLEPFDAIAKYLDQHTGARGMGLPSRGPISRVDVGAILREEATAAASDAARQGARFKIAPKRRGYESLAGTDADLGTALGQAFTDASVVEALLDLARRDGE